MKLTDSIRHAVVLAAVRDLPFTDYREEARRFVEDIAVVHLPAAVQEVWRSKTLRKYLEAFGHHYSWPGETEELVYNVTHYHVGDKAPLNAEQRDVLVDLAEKGRAQAAVQNRLKSQLGTLLRGYSTAAAFAKAVPEFAKYLPAEPAKPDRTLPVVANVVTEFIKAGWPKGQEPKS